jgi:hypothetical protein
MAMQTPALMALRHMGQEMGGFEGEFFKEFQGNTHGQEKTASVYQFCPHLPSQAGNR